MLQELLDYLQREFASTHRVPPYSGLDLEDFLRRTDSFTVPPVERLRQLAIFLERKSSTGYPAKDWAVLLQVYEFGANIDPTDYALWWSRGMAATHLAEIQGDPRLADPRLAEDLFAEGEASCRKALQLAPGNADILHSLGINAYMNSNRAVVEAKRWFTSALEKEPGHVMAQLYLGHCYQDTGQWREALDAYLRVDQDQLGRDWPSWRAVKLKEQIASCYLKCGLRDEAVRRFQEVLSVYEALNPNQAMIDLGFPDELVEAATGQLQADLFERTKACVEKNGQARLYAKQFASPSGPG